MGMIKKKLRNRFSGWINRRIPRGDSRTFSQKNIFILPTGAGLVFGVLLVIMLITGINYQNSLIYLLTFLLGALFVGAMHQTHRNLSGLTLELVSPGEGRAGDDIPFSLRIKAARDAGLAMSIAVDNSRIDGIHVPANTSREVTLPVPSAYRGYLRPDRIRIETRFPFGLLKAWSWLRPASAGVAWPRPVPAPEVTGLVDDGEEDRAARAVAGQDNADLRPWREGDMSQRVMWKRFARSGQMVVADWQGDQGSPHWLDFHGFTGADTELRLSYLAWLVAERTRQGARFGLNLPGEVIAPDVGTGHAERCLYALAVWGEQPPRGHDPLVYGTRRFDDAALGGGA